MLGRGGSRSGYRFGLRNRDTCLRGRFIGLLVGLVLQQHEYTGAYSQRGKKGAEEKKNVAFHMKKEGLL